MRKPYPAPAAVVIGADLNGLGVIRSLKAAGCAIYVVDETRRHPGCWSTLSRTFLLETLSGPDFVADLIRLAARIGGGLSWERFRGSARPCRGP